MSPRSRQPAATAAERLSPTMILVLQVAAVGLALAAQSVVVALPWLSVAGFALAAGCAFAAGSERLQPEPDDGTADAGTARGFWWLFAIGAVLCIAAGVAVRLERPPPTTHGLWLGGLLLLAASAVRAGWHRLRRWRPPGHVVAAVVLLLVVCAGLFAWKLTSIPPEVHGDDAEVGIDALRLLEEQPFNVFRTSWFQLPIFHALPTAIGLEVFGIDLGGLRGVSAILGTATVLLLFLLAYRLWSFEVALLAALFLASARYFIHLSRAGYHYVDTPFLSVLALVLFVSAWRHLRMGAAVWCGIALGLGVQTYYASRLVAVLLVVTWLLWLWGSEPSRRRRRLLLLGITIGAMLLTLAPMIGYFSSHWDELWLRTRDTSIFSRNGWEHVTNGYQTKNIASVIVQQLQKAVTLLNATHDTSLQYGYRQPMLEPLSAALFVIGVAGLCARLRERRHQLVLLWISIPLVAGAALTIDAPFYPRVSGIVPFVALAIALAIERLLAALRSMLPERSGQAIATLVAAGCVIVAATNNARSYFLDYAPKHRHGPAVEIAHWIRAHGTGKTTYMLGGAQRYSIRHGAIRFQTYGYDTRDIANLDDYAEPKRLDPAKSVFVILPEGKDLIPKLEAMVGPLVIEPHHRDGGPLVFYSAVPRQQVALPVATPRPGTPRASPTSGRVVGQSRATVPAPPLVGVVLGSIVLLAVAVAALMAVRRWRGGTRRHISATRLNLWRERAAAMTAFLFGPNDRERYWQVPPQLSWVLLALIVALAAFLRLYQLGSLPAGFYCDEAGLGYNAYSILQTARDETGALLPLNVWSFDTNYKNPVWIYSALPAIGLLGLTEFAVRLTSALYGIATVIALFFLGRALVGTTVGLLAALFLAVCPWHLHFSRIAFELITFPFFFIIGLTSLVRYAQGRRRLALAMVCFGYCLYTYAIAKLFIPLFLGGFVVLYRRTLWERWRETAAAVAVLVLLAAPLIIFDASNRERAEHYFSDTTVLSLDQPPAAVAQRVVAQYARFFSPEFLLYTGDYNLRHAVQDHGELYPFFAVPLLIGLATVLLRRDRALLLLLWWLLTYPVAPSLMREAPSASRGIIGVAAFCLLAAVGAGTVLRLAAQLTSARVVRLGLQLATAAVGLALLTPQVIQYWRLYVDEYPLYSAKYFTGFQYGHRQVIDYFQQHRDEYDQMILTAHRSNQAHIFPLFYGPFPPADYQSGGQPALRREAKTQVGWIKDLPKYEQYTRLLFAVTEDELPQLKNYDVREEVIAPDGTPAFMLVDVFPGRNFVGSWQIAGPYPAHDTSPPPQATDGGLPEAPDGRTWKPYHATDTAIGLDDFFAPDLEASCAWAVNFVQSPRKRTVNVRAAFDDYGEVWVNGRRVPLRVEPQPDAPLVDPQIGRVHLRRGRNLVAVRTCEEAGNWFFYLYFTDRGGKPLDLAWEY